jgi:hypothetical protein
VLEVLLRKRIEQLSQAGLKVRRKRLDDLLHALVDGEVGGLARPEAVGIV